ncbi:transglycosylase family protein [Streptomyces sp. NPDC086023]|uniref:transglycosylase family protein n=1 Tax=Streptomyces sp. NPDC086023 TaxID=3365746 RepID=UPI0037CF93E0
MRSGNGRHRRPRQAPALVVTAGVTGSALALPLLAATNASAADAATWDKVAECESGGTWSADLNNGFYGGLQFTQELWKEAGGQEYAPRADLASRSQQIAVAERVLAEKGPGAWPLCAAPAGLTKTGPKADVDDGLGKPKPVTPAPVRPDEGSGATEEAGTGTKTPAPPVTRTPAPPTAGTPSGTATPGATITPGATPGTATPGTPTAPGTGAPTTPGATGTPGTPGATDGATPGATPGATDGSATPGPGRHRGNAADETSGDVSGETDGTGRHALTLDPLAPDAGSGTGVTPEGAGESTYIVKSGDSLSGIADAKGLKGGWAALYKANEQVIGDDADLIKPGQNLDLSQN